MSYGFEINISFTNYVVFKYFKFIIVRYYIMIINFCYLNI